VIGDGGAAGAIYAMTDVGAVPVAFVALEFMPLLDEQAAARQAHGLTAPGKGTLVAPGPQAFTRAPLSRDLAAATVGTSGRSVARAKAIRTRRTRR